MDSREYNGWHNHATWNIGLIITNDYGLYHEARAFMKARSKQNHGMIPRSEVEKDAYEDFIENIKDFIGKQTSDGVPWLGEDTYHPELDKMMMEFITEDREPADVTPDGKWECPRCYHDNQRDAAAEGKIAECAECEWTFTFIPVPFTVDVIAKGYEWHCPTCGRFNEEIEYTAEVTCPECQTTCNASEPEHAWG